MGWEDCVIRSRLLSPGVRFDVSTLSHARAATLYSGADVDRYLSRCGALAQAVNRNTVLASSRLFALDTAERQLILLHECAHLAQLARPGNDPVQSLEDEAWEAACAWFEGRPYPKLRGRANGPLNALAVIQGGKKGHPHAPLWYRTSPVEPIGNKSTISVDATTVIEDITLEGILDAIISAKGTKEVVIVSHGSGDGLAFPITAKSTAGAEKAIIYPLSADKVGVEVSDNGTKSQTPKRTDKDVADMLGLTEAQVTAFRVKMNQVRTMKLKHVAFRACNMGISKEAMQAFRNFFGAASVSAPKDFDAYGMFSPSIGSGLKDWTKSKRDSGYHIAITDGVGFGIKDTDSIVVYTIVARSPDDDTFRAWVRKHIADGAWDSNGVVFHGIREVHPVGPESPAIFFVRDPEFIADIVNYAG
jgi:hypothetical protein